MREYEREATQALLRAKVDSPRLSVQLMVQHTLGLSKVDQLLAGDRGLSAGEIRALDGLLERRSQGEPVALILGRKEFYGLDFKVSAETLIPRPDTELLVELALREGRRQPTRLRFIDMGAGCGCIGVSICKARPQWQGVLFDNSPAALEIAAHNAARHGMEGRLATILGDIFAPPLRGGSYEMLVSNPPYIADAEKNTIMREVLDFEPHAALFSQEQGLRHLKGVVRAGEHLLKEGGAIFLEHGADQGAEVRRFLSEQRVFTDISTIRDLAGRERCTCARKLGSTS